MKQIVKTLLVMLSIAMCLTSDTASYATLAPSGKLPVQKIEPRSSKNSVAFVGTTPKPLYWECQNWTPLVPMLPSESIQK